MLEQAAQMVPQPVDTEELINELKPDDLTEPMATIARLAGVETVVALAREYGGMNLYIPKIDGLVRQVRDNRLRAEFTGYNYRELARRYNLSEAWVRAIVAGTEPPDLPGQDSFDFEALSSGS